MRADVYPATAEAASCAGTETSAEQFRKNPEVLCSSVSWESESDRTVWVYKVRIESLAEPRTVACALCYHVAGASVD